MKIKVHDWHTEIFLNDHEIKKFCRIGEGAECCVWLVVGPNGFECTYHNKPSVLMNRYDKGLTTAKRDGCGKVKNMELIDQ